MPKSSSPDTVIDFSLRYAAPQGQRLAVCWGNNAQLLAMTTADGYAWHARCCPAASTAASGYAYVVVNKEGDVVRREAGGLRSLPGTKGTCLVLLDSWRERGVEPELRHSAFEGCTLRFEGRCPTLKAGSVTLRLQAAPPQRGTCWAVLGSSEGLGRWQAERAKRMKRVGALEWDLPLAASEVSPATEYKYVLLDEESGTLLAWEEGDNRQLPPATVGDEDIVVVGDDAPRLSLPGPRVAGMVVPVFALRSKTSLGVGDFGDMRRLLPWLKRTGMRALQILPVNDTTASYSWRDSYPYSCVSAFALHPLYLDASEWADTTAYRRHAPAGAALNTLPAIDYERVMELKQAFLVDLYAEVGQRVTATRAFGAFCKENSEWLEPYARFCVLRGRYGTAHFASWPAGAAAPSEAELRFHRFVQYVLHHQLCTVHDEARALGIILKGDIPIGIARDSVPAWVDAPLFHFDGQAGAPPDAFAVKGQNWGFPTYDWDTMAADGYAWWRRRLRHMAHYFDAYRIDHVLGFFRIWEIPTQQVEGIMGHFRPAWPLSPEELCAWGFTASARRFSVPFVTESRLLQLETEAGPLRHYFTPLPGGLWELKPEWRAQRYTAEHVPDEAARRVLMEVATEVLFISAEHPGAGEEAYHPRVAAQFTHVFEQLTEADRQAFNRLYDHYYYDRHNAFWASEARTKLAALEAYVPANAAELPMLPCAEDLGMVPASVKDVLEELHILSLEIERMPKCGAARFADPAANPYRSVATISTHDMPPLCLWWQTERDAAEAYWAEVLGRAGEAPIEATTEVCRAVVERHLASPSMLCLLSFQDWTSISAEVRHPQPELEQINVPANPHHYWRYRMHLTIEQLLAAHDFNTMLRGLIQASGR